MRCYFHLMSGSEVIRDPEGVEVTSLDGARTQAHKAIQDLVQEDPTSAASWAGWRLEVCDAAGAVLFSISLDRAGTF